jgi:hypothetical protein
MNKMKQKEEMLIKQLEKNEIEKQKLYDYIDKLIEKQVTLIILNSRIIK